jgi:hypothetical protein
MLIRSDLNPLVSAHISRNGLGTQTTFPLNKLSVEPLPTTVNFRLHLHSFTISSFTAGSGKLAKPG